jgi:hypothetical protein
MSKLIEKISKFSLLILGIISVILVVLMYLGGNTDSMTIGEESLTVPKFTDALLYWSYFLVVLSIAITLLLTIYGFVKKLTESPMDALKSLIPLAIFAAIFIIAWFFGSTEKISIIGYEGTENEGFWAQFSDMLIYSIYVLFIGIAVTIVGSGIYKSAK